MKPFTPFIATEALLLAIEDYEADNGNHDPLDRYIVENLTPRDRRKLASAARRLEIRCWAMRDQVVECLPSAGSEGSEK